MKVLLATSRGDDYVSACCHDGLQEVLGEENVYDAAAAPSLHRGGHDNPCGRVGGTRRGRLLADEDNFDLLVLHSCFLKDHDWHWPWRLRERLRRGGRVAYVEGWDGASQVHDPLLESDPPFRVDAVFRREIDPRLRYPYRPQPFMMSAPSRWFYAGGGRHIDVIYLGRAVGYEGRWDVCKAVFETESRHLSVVASTGLDFERYFDYLKVSKLGPSPPGGAHCGDCLRTWELVACGVIPIFVNYREPRVREPWFAPDEVFEVAEAVQLPGLIDVALTMDLDGMRVRMQERALREHTTAARVRRMLEVVGG